jgi:two-component system, NtrC family, sensor histidine kinase GlrK
VRKWLNRLGLTQQWVGATLLAMLPLSVAVAYGGWSLAVQTQNQRQLVAHLQRQGRIEANLLEKITDIERAARQFNLLKSPKFLTLVQQDISLLSEQVAKLQQEVNQKDVIQASSQLATKAQALEPLLQSQPDSALLGAALAGIKAHRDQLVRQLDIYSQGQLDAMDARFNRAFIHLMVIGILAVPGTLLLVTLSSVAVARPLGRLANAIENLGHARWQTPIRIEGPKDLQNLGENLEWMRLRLVVNDRQKQAFLQHITHELKTPLAAITEAGRLLREQLLGPTNPEQQEVIGILLNNADSLHELIQQLLNYNAVTQGLVAKHHRFDVRQISEKIRQKILETRPNSRCHWQVPAHSLSVHSDQQLVTMILSNLLSNAHDFSGENGTVSLDWGEDAEHWWLSVADNGPGIAKEEMHHLFKPFYQGRARRNGSLKGSGMGLAIVHESVSLLGGKLSLRSTLKKGSRFVLRFPKDPETTA